MKRYILFAGDFYYPNGGVKDIKGSFETVTKAKEHVDNQNNKKDWGWDWWQIVDKETMSIISENP